MKTVAYIRVSTADQDNSLEVQEKHIRQYCSFRAITLDQIITDEDVSGHKEIYTREGGSMLQNLPEGSNVIVTKLDRMFRNAKDALITIDEWSKKDISLHIIDMGGASFTTKTAVGRLFFTTLVSFAEFERNSAGERTKSVLSNRKATGKAYCRSIFGYDNVGGTPVPGKPGRFKGGHLQQNLAEQAILSEIRNLKDANTPEAEIARILNSRGHKSKTGGRFHQSTIRTILSNPIHNQTA